MAYPLLTDEGEVELGSATECHLPRCARLIEAWRRNRFLVATQSV